MAEWRALRGWSEPELERRMAELEGLPPSLDPALATAFAAPGHETHASEATIGAEPPGLPFPRGAFERARDAITSYAFSDPRIVTAHFDASAPLLGRRMLLEIKVLGLRFLSGVVVGEVVSRDGPDHTTFAFRYDTLAGHIESGCEWFVLTKHHRTGEVRFRIHALWRTGELPTWWSRLGFALLARRYQEDWHRLAYLRLRRLAGSDPGGLGPLPRRGRLIHAGPRLPDAASEWRFPEVSRGSRIVHPGTRQALRAMQAAAVGALGFGAMAGMRSLSAPAFLSHALARTRTAPTTQPARALASPRVAQLLAAAAIGEALADKSGWIPPRTAPVALAGRALSGAACGIASAPGGAHPSWLPALLGAGAAVASGTVSQPLRRRLGERLGLPDPVVALAEDALVCGLGAALLRRRTGGGAPRGEAPAARRAPPSPPRGVRADPPPA